MKENYIEMVLDEKDIVFLKLCLAEKIAKSKSRMQDEENLKIVKVYQENLIKAQEFLKRLRIEEYKNNR